jgi:secreted Zn-dependent insulinase-like peptidase
MHIESLVHGNMTETEALELADVVEKAFEPEALTPKELESHTALIVPEGAFSSLSSCALLPVDG